MWKREFSFWFLLAILNCLFFLPGFLITSLNDVMLVDQGDVENTYPFYEKLFYRFNYDVFRGGVEFTLISIFLLYFKYKFSQTKGQRLLFWVYICSFWYLFYMQVSCLLYQSTPLFFNDFFVLVDAILLFFEFKLTQLMLIILGLIILTLLIYYLICKFWFVIYEVLPKRLSLVFSLVLLFFSIIRFRDAKKKRT